MHMMTAFVLGCGGGGTSRVSIVSTADFYTLRIYAFYYMPANQYGSAARGEPKRRKRTTKRGLEATWQGEPAMYPSSSSASSADEGEASAGPDNLGDRRKVRDKGTNSKNPPRREEKLFSLKQFLKNDKQANHQYAGARPKVYEPLSRTPEPDENHDTEKYPRNPTELPDFVQDHLVIEQCYLGETASSNLNSVEIDNLPDFALNSVEKRHIQYLNDHWNKNAENSEDLSLPLSGRSDKSFVTNSSHRGSLELPKLVVDVIDGESADVPETLGFPFDLPMPRGTESNSVADVTANHPLPEGIPNSTKLLPDFLSDAPIRTRGNPLSDRPDGSGTGDSMNQWLSMENERLRNELQMARRQASERAMRIENLEAELSSRRQVNHTDSINLEKAMEQVEDNLKRSTKRAISAETTVATLKKEIDSLSMEIIMLRTENRELRAAIGVEGNGFRNVNPPDRRIQRLADDLRLAASTAEVSLRQLMSGVSNLRVLASALENVDKIEDRTKDFLPDFDEDNAAGPAL